MVKISGVLGGLLVFFTSTLGFVDINVSCDIYGVEVEVTHLYDVGHMLLQAHELSLGYGCPVSYIDHHTDHEIFVFVYLLEFCGIRVHELPQGILIESSVTYASVQLNVTLQFPVSCFIPRNTLPLLDQKSPLLVQYGDSAKDLERYYKYRHFKFDGLMRISPHLWNTTNNVHDHHPLPISVGYFFKQEICHDVYI